MNKRFFFISGLESNSESYLLGDEDEASPGALPWIVKHLPEELSRRKAYLCIYGTVSLFGRLPSILNFGWALIGMV